ncbi:MULTISPECIES: BLUF domain-containing protein [unclassified Polynucleobacter]|jgi:predicted nucleotidyltransferase|uniref:BLUF domain-containing protein n=1 Tax=unclassified Polynucleobacter TaxID=2640945 RepID=UPI001BFD24C2|nr:MULTISPECIES: BLUF domain-containing protein [unclassified Polynucleobacter]MEA9601263.1 BLUF domain-containing protein [Polynucleobacter sp. MG-28-Ekke-A2]QWD81988.1 BLUF domain-containing protein [Polynucleobacter sp. MWH-S4W17]
MPKPKDLVELSYLSEAVSDMSFLGLMRLLESARAFNQKNGVTGILLYDNQQFGQIIEGEHANVMKAWKRIQEDKRHHRVELLEIREITERNFPDWLLRFYGGETLTRDYPALTDMVGGMDKHSLALMNKMRASLS